MNNLASARLQAVHHVGTHQHTVIGHSHGDHVHVEGRYQGGALADRHLQQFLLADVLFCQKLRTAVGTGQTVGKFFVEHHFPQSLAEPVLIQVLGDNLGEGAVAGMGKCLLEILLMVMLIVKAMDTHVPLAEGPGVTVKREVLHGGGIFAEQFNRVQDLECRPGRIGTLGGPVDQHSIAAGVILQIFPDILKRVGVEAGQGDHGADLAGGRFRDDDCPPKILP